MQIRMRVFALAILGFSAAGFAVVQPRPVVDVVAAAPVLAPFYAPPAEEVDAHVLRRGETVSDVFLRAALGRELSGLVLALREYVDPRRILPNTEITVRRWAGDSIARAVEVALNPDTTLRLNRGTVGWSGELLVTPTTLDTVYVSGLLGQGGSLYGMIMDNPTLGLPQRDREALVWQLARIYGWEVDFAHDIRPGDSFRVAFQREVRPDGTARTTRVLMAEITSQGRRIPAIFFDPTGEGGDYYNREGESLRLAFLRYPVDFPRITSSFSWKRYHPILERNRPHLGTDFGAARGTPVRSTADGTVSFADVDGGYGNLIRIRHGNGYQTRYAHLSRYAKGIRRGRKVKQGQIIGYVGATGLATGPHLHYELRQFNRPMDPRKVRLPAAPPVPEEHMAAFREVSQARSQMLAVGAPLHETTTLAAH